MAEFSSLTHKFRANLDSQQPGGANKVSKRNRQPLSCFLCRQKKLKCDRGHPCDSCTKRRDQSNCTYGKMPLSKPLEASANGGNVTNIRGRAHERLRHLEQLVMQMVDNTNGAQSSHRSDSVAATASANDADTQAASIANEGHLQYGSSESRYVGSTHWSAILENIQELKSALDSSTSNQGTHPSSTELDESDDVEPQEIDGLFGSTSHISLPQVLSHALPPRLQVDRRLSTYFNSRYLVIPVIHTQQFQREYEQFWRTPLETPPLWISILFSICCISAALSEALGSEPPPPEDQPSPRLALLNAACQCLRLGGFTRPKRYVTEALGLYAQCKYMATLDPSGDVGIIFSILVRLAYRSGYHRDPSQFPHFSVFEAEMRRRRWAMCRQFDLMVSFQLGLPNQIQPNSWDTLNPRNLLDTDFDEETKALPPSRPETEATQILYFIVKSRLMTTFGKVCTHALSFRDGGCLQQEVMDLDKEIRATYATVPEVLHIRPMSQSFADPSYLVMVRTNCEFLYQKSIIVLHRKYMTQGTHPTSAQACTDAAMAITRHMLDLHKEFKPGGQLFQDRWMLSSFTMNDFYLAAVVLCLGVSMWKKVNPGKDVNEDEKMQEQCRMLKDSFGICEELSQTSNEAKRVANVLRVVLGEKGDATMLQSGGSLVSSPNYSNPFMQPGRFMGSAMFPMQYDFNLTPLTLQEEQQIRQSVSNSSDSSSSQIQQDQNQVGEGRALLPNSTTHSSSTMNNFQYLMPGINNPTGLGPSSFMSFLPFSAAYTPPTPASHLQAQTTTSGALVDHPGTSTAEMPDIMPMNLDVDWPFLDQWMALPDADITPFNDSNLPGYTMTPPSIAFPAAQQPPETRHTLREGQSQASNGRELAADAQTTVEGNWTSTPYRFLGGEVAGVNEKEASGRQERGHATVEGGGRGDGGTYVNGNGRGRSSLGQAEGHYPSY